MHPSSLYSETSCRKEDDGTTLVLSGTCRITGKLYTISVPSRAYKWLIASGDSIQNVLSMVDPLDREFIMTGNSPLGNK